MHAEVTATRYSLETLLQSSPFLTRFALLNIVPQKGRRLRRGTSARPSNGSRPTNPGSASV